MTMTVEFLAGSSLTRAQFGHKTRMEIDFPRAGRRGRRGPSRLTTAAWEGDIEAVKVLLDEGEDPNQKAHGTPSSET